MRADILEIKKSNPSFGYGRIAKIIGCSKNTVKYNLKESNHLRVKIFRFLARKLIKKDYNKANVDEAEKKIRQNPVCYLTGEKIDLSEPHSYHLDHIVPVSKGGNNSLENLGLLSAKANRAKHNQTIEEHLQYCRDVLNYLNKN